MSGKDSVDRTSQLSINMTMKKEIPQEISVRITSLRFLLIVLVVFIHNNFTPEYILEIVSAGGEPVIFNQNLFGKWIQIFISDGLARAAVPMFFVFSSYLFFMKNDSYGVMLKKKFHSLLVPLVTWSAINLLLFVFLKQLMVWFVPSLVTNPEKIYFSGWTICDWVCAFFGYTRKQTIQLFSNYSVYGGNLAVQFWFIRDLLLMMVISPLIKKLVRKFPFEFLIFSSFFYVCNIRPVIVMHQAFFYFVLGCYFSEYDFDFFSFADRIHWKFILPMFAISLWYFTAFTDFPAPSRWFPVLCSCVIFLKLSKTITLNSKSFFMAKQLAKYSFFLFAAHSNFIMQTIQNLWLKFFPMKNAFLCLAEYFCVSGIVIVLCTGGGFLVHKISPSLFSFLNGGRK